MNVLYVTYENVHRTPILQAMVLKPLSLLAEKYGISFTITSSIKPHESDALYEENKAHFEAKGNADITVVEFQKKLTKKLNPFQFLFDLLPMIRYSILAARNCDIIHCRSYGGAIIGLVASIFSGTPFIFDMRGTLPEEMLELGELQERSLRFKALKWVEWLLIRRASYVLTVSNAFNDYVTSTFKKANCVNINNPTDFDCYRPGVSSKKKVNFIYSGSMLVWHQPELTIRYFSEIQKRFPNEVYFYFCTNEPKRAEEIFTQYNVPQNAYEINTVPFLEMPDYYAKSDIAFLMTKESFITSVCSPVKFSEYVASELFILAPEGIGDTEKIIRKYNCGLILDDLNNVKDNIDKIGEIISQRLGNEHSSYSRDGIQFLNWRTEGIDKIYAVYLKILEEE